MRIRGSLETAIGLAGIFTCPLSESDKETLVRRKTLDWLQVCTCRGFLPCDVSNQRSAEVSDILTARELGVNVDVVNHDVGCELVTEAINTVLEAVGVFFGPPVFEIALRVKLAALVVET